MKGPLCGALWRPLFALGGSFFALRLLACSLSGISDDVPGAADASHAPEADAPESDGGGSDALEAASGARTALKLSASCARAAAVDERVTFSDTDFTVEFWCQIGKLAPSGLAPIVASGGESAVAGGGWRITLSGTDLEFCVSDRDFVVCTVGWTVAGLEGHLLHVAGVSQKGLGDGRRALQLYLLDATANESTHRLVDTRDNAAPNNWLSKSIFTIGGTTDPDGGCLGGFDGLVDDLRLWGRTFSLAQLDAHLRDERDRCVAPDLVTDYRFDEGSGATAVDCSSSRVDLTLLGNTTWAASPFPGQP